MGKEKELRSTLDLDNLCGGVRERTNSRRARFGWLGGGRSGVAQVGRGASGALVSVLRPTRNWLGVTLALVEPSIGGEIIVSLGPSTPKAGGP